MALKTDNTVIGVSATDTNNFLLDTDLAGALRLRRKTDGSGGTILTVDSVGKVTFTAQPAVPVQSMVRCHTANGHASTNTMNRRFSNATVTGTDITYADSATAGATFTIATSGVYAISYNDAFGSQTHFGLSLNSTQLTTAITSITVGDILAQAFTTAANNESFCGCTAYFPAGSVIRPHTSGAANAVSLALTQFTIVRVA